MDKVFAVFQGIMFGIILFLLFWLVNPTGLFIVIPCYIVLLVVIGFYLFFKKE